MLGRIRWLTGSDRVFLVPVGSTSTLDVVTRDILGKGPVRCLDIREASSEARNRGELLAIETSSVYGVGCPAVRLGAHLAVFEVSTGLLAACASSDAPSWLSEALREASAEVDGRAPAIFTDTLDDLLQKHRSASDAAQVVAHYLACHPRVETVAYPGLRSDPSYAVASRTLLFGFGPRVSWRTVGRDAWCDLELCPDDDPLDVIARLEGELAHV